MGSYKMEVNKVKQEVNIAIIGSFTPEQAELFMKEYNRHINTIKATDFTLLIDCTDLTVVTPDLVPALEACYTLYESSKFNKVIFEIKNNTIIKMQLNRIARKVGLKAEIVEI